VYVPFFDTITITWYWKHIRDQLHAITKLLLKRNAPLNRYGSIRSQPSGDPFMRVRVLGNFRRVYALTKL